MFDNDAEHVNHHIISDIVASEIHVECCVNTEICIPECINISMKMNLCCS